MDVSFLTEYMVPAIMGICLCVGYVVKHWIRDADNREFFDQSNPWALHDISERLLEAADRGLWENPDEDRLDLLRETFLETEGDLEER